MEKNQAEFLMDLFKKRDNIKRNLDKTDGELKYIKEHNNLSYCHYIFIQNTPINNDLSVESNISILNSMRDIINKEYQDNCAYVILIFYLNKLNNYGKRTIK